MWLFAFGSLLSGNLWEYQVSFEMLLVAIPDWALSWAWQRCRWRYACFIDSRECSKVIEANYIALVCPLFHSHGPIAVVFFVYNYFSKKVVFPVALGIGIAALAWFPGANSVAPQKTSPSAVTASSASGKLLSAQY